MEFKLFGSEELDAVKALYKEMFWTSYLSDGMSLERAFDKSLYCLGAFDRGQLVAFVRCLGDGEHLVFIQDLIVAKSYHRQGIGGHLLQAVFDHFQQVRRIQLVTDLNDQRSNAFYQHFNMKSLDQGEMIAYFRE
ncbi:GNAT family N-acetyltransferase [Streptococcus ictaluri]|uniref:Acetyltransferase, GNAT family n=1 Tax=Streptococcus ictaluri 707-05 TaxID=764299 RepID=G5K3K6_9STRE|nr:GNAT family N-acetyltransferase [Streptococcus ictaluri]EHI69618.1 acetyltransferase, GNAT family [Streptococcus ictaluri 707-05]